MGVVWAGALAASPLDALAASSARVHAAQNAGVYLAAYNGNSNESGSSIQGLNGYGIGFATSDDGARSFTRVSGGKLFKPAPSGWDSGFVKDPSIAVVGRRLFLAYSGTQDGFTIKIGLAVWNNGIPIGPPNARILLMDTVGAPAWQSGAVHFPHLYYDESAGLLHLWYSGQSSPGTTTSSIGHATVDPSTYAVTFDPANPIITPNSAFGEGGLVMGCVFPANGTWNLFTGTFSPDASTAVSTRFTAPASTGPWTRDGVVYNPRPNAVQALAADASSGSTSVSVSDSSVFTKGDPVYVQDSLTGTNSAVLTADNWEVNYVAALPDANHVTLLNPLANAYAVARSAQIVAADQAKVMPRSCLQEGNTYVLPSTAWFAGNQTYHEDTVALVTPDLSAKPYALDRARELLLYKSGSTGATRNAWDKTSSENMSAIPYSGIAKVVSASLRSPLSRVTKKVNRSLTLNNSTWSAVNSPGPPGQGLDGYLAAESGDLIRVTPQLEVASAARWVYFDLATVVYPNDVGTYISWASGGSGQPSDQGVLAWRAPQNVFVPLGASIVVQIGDRDIECNMVNLRLMYRLSAGTNGRDLDVSFAVTYENLGGGQE
jgi:hypothetical protein